MHPAPTAATFPTMATAEDPRHRPAASRRLRIRHTLSGLAHQLRNNNQSTPQQMMSRLGSHLNAMIPHRSYERIEHRKAESEVRHPAPSEVRREVRPLAPPPLAIVPLDTTVREESPQSPEQELSNLTVKTLLDARALCLKRLRKLTAENRRAEAAILEGAGVDTHQLQDEVGARREEIHRWQSRLRVADAELSRRGMAPPKAVAHGDADSDDGFPTTECPED